MALDFKRGRRHSGVVGNLEVTGWSQSWQSESSFLEKGVGASWQVQLKGIVSVFPASSYSDT